MKKKQFHRTPLYFRINADFKTDKEIDNSIKCNKTTIIHKQIPVFNVFFIKTELEDVLESGSYESASGYNKVVWYVKEVIKLGNKMASYFKNTKKQILMTEEYEEGYRKNTVCRFCDEEFLTDKVRDQCHLTGEYRGPVHNNCNINVTRK